MSALAAEIVKWSALGKEALIALIGGVGVVAAYGLAVIGANRYLLARRAGRAGSASAGITLALIGGAICLVAVVLGIVAMTHKS